MTMKTYNEDCLKKKKEGKYICTQMQPVRNMFLKTQIILNLKDTSAKAFINPALPVHCTDKKMEPQKSSFAFSTIDSLLSTVTGKQI